MQSGRTDKIMRRIISKVKSLSQDLFVYLGIAFIVQIFFLQKYNFHIKCNYFQSINFNHMQRHVYDIF